MGGRSFAWIPRKGILGELGSHVSLPNLGTYLTSRLFVRYEVRDTSRYLKIPQDTSRYLKIQGEQAPR